MQTHKYIAIEGVIGVGKTTLARLLEPYFNATILLEIFEENPFLADFYGDRERYAFQTQIFFLLSRYQQQRQAVPQALTKGNLISDYTFAKDELFAWLNLKDDELAMYGRVHAALGEKIPKPDLIVYLQASHEATMRRITLRDRPYERDMDPNYIRELAVAYENWLANVQETAVLTIDTTDLDFLSRSQDLDLVADRIQKALVDKAAADPPPIPAQLERGHLATYQQFHRQLDASKRLDPDLFFDFIRLNEEMGAIAAELAHIWRHQQQLTAAGRPAEEARRNAITLHRDTLRHELADLLAYTLKLANDAGINLEQAYLEKMNHNIGRQRGSDNDA